MSCPEILFKSFYFFYQLVVVVVVVFFSDIQRCACVSESRAVGGLGIHFAHSPLPDRYRHGPDHQHVQLSVSQNQEGPVELQHGALAFVSAVRVFLGIHSPVVHHGQPDRLERVPQRRRQYHVVLLPCE